MRVFLFFAIAQYKTMHTIEDRSRERSQKKQESLIWTFLEIVWKLPFRLFEVFSFFFPALASKSIPSGRRRPPIVQAAAAAKEVCLLKRLFSLPNFFHFLSSKTELPSYFYLQMYDFLESKSTHMNENWKCTQWLASSYTHPANKQTKTYQQHVSLQQVYIYTISTTDSYLYEWVNDCVQGLLLSLNTQKTQLVKSIPHVYGSAAGRERERSLNSSSSSLLKAEVSAQTFYMITETKACVYVCVCEVVPTRGSPPLAAEVISL